VKISEEWYFEVEVPSSPPFDRALLAVSNQNNVIANAPQSTLARFMLSPVTQSLQYVLQFPPTLPAALLAAVRVIDSIVEHRNILYHEDIVFRWWTSRPSCSFQQGQDPIYKGQPLTIVAIRPVIPDPGARFVRHVCGVFLLQFTVEIESGKVFRPINTIFMDFCHIVWCWSSLLCCLGARIDGLIRIPDWNRSASRRLLVDVIGLGVWIGEIFYITLLRVIQIEEDTWLVVNRVTGQ